MPVQILKELIKIPSVYGNEKEIADFCHQFLKENSNLKLLRVSNSIVAHSSLDPGKRTVALVGHLDTVPGENRYTGKVIDGKLYGLGASDMKAGDAVILKVAEDLKNKSSRFNVLLILYEKEEGPYRDNGLKLLFNEFGQLLKGIDFAFVLEPTDNKVQVGCLGVVHAWFKFKGKRAHSARPWEGENAIHKGGELLTYLNSLKPKPYTVGGLTYYEVLNATMVEYIGGRNIIPQEFKVNLNYRFSPTKEPQEAVKELKELGERFGAEVEVTDVSPSARACIDNQVLREFVDRFNLELQPKQAWTDVAQLSSYGIDAVNFGPGQPHQAHQKDEWVEIGKVEENYKILREFLLK